MLIYILNKYTEIKEVKTNGQKTRNNLKKYIYTYALT